MSRLCRWVLIGFAALCVAAFALFPVGHCGWSGSPQGPPAGVFPVPLARRALRPWLAA